jgi:hypothetical protein
MFNFYVFYLFFLSLKRVPTRHFIRWGDVGQVLYCTVLYCTVQKGKKGKGRATELTVVESSHKKLKQKTLLKIFFFSSAISRQR